MPTYEYHCEACGYRFEKFQSMTEEPISVCPKCHIENVERLISGGGGLIFKGSGFYTTDYRGKKYKKQAQAEKPKSSVDSSSSSKSDDKKKPKNKKTEK
ncbi:MAG: hypothetical protein B6244_09560 [Candidatus Cloacimonetes bacterium 4572_55]|nr:MAG: hypothetical protein B6244_09560 [Candidatus Cloacimonetes bacterium 4572_55]